MNSTRYLFCFVPIALAIASACTPRPPPTAEARAQQQALGACRQRADQIFEQRNRGAFYIDTDQRYSPFSGDYVSGNTARGLPERYGRDQLVTECVRSSGTPVDRGAGPTMEPTGELGQ